MTKLWVQKLKMLEWKVMTEESVNDGHKSWQYFEKMIINVGRKDEYDDKNW